MSSEVGKTGLTQEEAVKDIAACVAAAYEALAKAEQIADEYELSFSFSPAYGMGGYYSGNKDDRDEYDPDNGWSSSSQNC